MTNAISTHTLTWSVTFARLTKIITISFQLTRSRGAWLTGLMSSLAVILFQLTRSRGAWLATLKNIARKRYFNSHAHVERDNLMTALDVDLSNFNSHAHVERDEGWRTCQHRLYDFNSHAHVERDTWCCVYLVLAQRDADLLFYLMGIGLILFTVHSQIAWHFHANLLGICGSLGVRWSKY